MRTVGPRQALRAMLDAGEPVVAPGATSALMARLIEEAGFPAVYMTGAGVAHSLLGKPDIGLTTLTEMVQQVESLSRAVSVPVIADADTGFGGVPNVVRTVELYESRGAAAIQIEDQVNPKRCGHFSGKEVVPPHEMVARIRAAVAARTDPDFLIIGRTDARAVEGIDAAVERGHRYVEAGADVLFIEAPETGDELATIGRTFQGVPLVANIVDGGRTPQLPVADLVDMGYGVLIFPGFLTRITVHAVREALGTLRTSGDTRALHPRMAGFQEVNEVLGLTRISRLVQDVEREAQEQC